MIEDVIGNLVASVIARPIARWLWNHPRSAWWIIVIISSGGVIGGGILIASTPWYGMVAGAIMMIVHLALMLCVAKVSREDQWARFCADRSADLE